MNTKLFLGSLALTLTVGAASAQMAINTNAAVSGNVQVTSTNATGSVRSETNANASVRGNATSTTKKDNTASASSTTNASSTHSNASSTGAEHMSTVARFVQSLLSIANRDGGIGAQVRAIAQAQNDTASTTVAAMTKVESRSKLMTFFFGSDSKSIGQLRSDMAKTEANVVSLQTLITKTTDASVKADLEAQIKALQDSQVQLNAFIKAHESSFSLFGWFTQN